MFPRFFRNVCSGHHDLRITFQQEDNEFFAKLLHAFCFGASSQRINGVLHRVGWKDLAVISSSKAGLKVSLEQNLDGPVAKLVAAGMPFHSYNPDARFTVPVFG